MRVIWAIAKREIHAFFVSPIAYVVLTVWLLFSGLSFFYFANIYATTQASGGSDNPLSAFFGTTILFFLPQLVFVPVLTMRLLAEERKSGTLESLFTVPVTEWQVVLGKYFAAMVFWISLWVPTLLYVWITAAYGDEARGGSAVDMGTVAASYLGVLGIGLYYISIGLLASAVAPNQIVAAVLTFMFLGLLFLLGIGQFVFYDTTREVLAYLSVWGHMSDFSRGIVDSRYLVFDVSLAALALFLSVRVLQSRRLQP